MALHSNGWAQQLPPTRWSSPQFPRPPACRQVFVRGEFVGGSDILMEMHKAGQLGELADELAAEAKA